ncbi:(2Fe-2S)-binding protein [Alicyclobacillus acidoterrestris]|uniref:(2Fe-2S)-binding protein n=1 Tax=Alicyclobacillus acidoterrestris TaxID=1450 RepID=UPI003F53DCC7
MRFEEAEWYFRLTTKDQENVSYEVRVNDLVTDQHQMLCFLEMYQSQIGTADMHVPAVAFCKWFSLVAAGFQYFVSVENSAVDLSPGNLTIQAYPVGDYTFFSFKVHRDTATRAPEDGAQRNVWRERAFAAFYGDTVRPVIDRLAEQAGIGAGQLWGQFPPKLMWFIDVVSKEMDGGLQQRIEEDYQYLISEVDPRVFGRKRNPFAIRWKTVESMEDPRKQVYLQPTCCMNYRLEGIDYCYTCPRLTEAERAERREAFRSANCHQTNT